MNNLLELTMADGKELDIPTGTVFMFEELLKGFHPSFPEAKSFIRYSFGANSPPRTAMLMTKMSDLKLELDINVQPPGKWLVLHRMTGEEVVLLVDNVVGRMAMEDGTEVSYLHGQEVEVAHVKESRREIKKMSEREIGRPEGLIELPVPEENK